MKRILFSVCVMAITFGVKSQTTTFFLDDIIALAQSKSPKFRLIQTQREISEYQFQTYQSEFKPQISLYGNAPVYNKEYYGVRQPDGTIKYLSISQNNSNVGFSISQQLPFSGGLLSLNTEISRFDDFKSDVRQYNGTPVYLRLQQPLFAVNELKWRQRIEPLKLEESKRNYVQELETIAQECVNLYFDVLDAQSNMEIASTNLVNTKNNYETEKKRINLGTTTEDKLLQLELQSLRSKQDLERSRYDYQVAQLALKSYIGLKTDAEIHLNEPRKIPLVQLNVEETYEYAKRNRKEFISFVIKLKEAQRDVLIAKAAKQQVDLVASYGLNAAGQNFSDVYRSPNDQQRFSIGFNIPIVDWGRRRARYKTAKAIETLTIVTNELDESVIYQEIVTLVKTIDLLKSNIVLAKTTDSVALRRFTIANNLYQTGKLSVTDLNLAQAEKDQSRRSYIESLRAYWDSYYILRRMTLFDFETNNPIYRKKN